MSCEGDTDMTSSTSLSCAEAASAASTIQRSFRTYVARRRTLLAYWAHRLEVVPSERWLDEAWASSDLGLCQLCAACASGDVLAAHLLLRSKARVDGSNGDRHTPLFIACQRGHDECVQILLEFHATDKSAQALSAACVAGWPKCATLLLEHGTQLAVDLSQRGVTALHLACARGELPTVTPLAPHGKGNATKAASGAARNDNASTAFDEDDVEIGDVIAGIRPRLPETPTAAHLGHATVDEWLRGQHDCVRALLDHGASVDALLRDGHSPLMLSCGRDRAPIANLLLEHGAQVNHRRDDGTNALMMACQASSAECVRLLIEHKAQVDAALPDGTTPLMVVCQAQCDADIAKALIDRGGATVNLARADGATALIIAVTTGQLDLARVLLERRADTSMMYNRATALHFACEVGEPSAVSLLLECNANIEQPRGDETGFTPLHTACAQGRAECARGLLEANASIDSKANGSWTPMLLSCVEGQLRCVQLLSSYGASRFHETVGMRIPAEQWAERQGHTAVAVWLRLSAGWSTPLHHLDPPDILTPRRAAKLLAEGADLNARRAAGAGMADNVAYPTPHELALKIRRPKKASAASLVLAATRPWSPATHYLFPPTARRRATLWLRLGYELAWRSEWSVGREQALIDVWRDAIIAHLVVRE